MRDRSAGQSSPFRPSARETIERPASLVDVTGY